MGDELTKESVLANVSALLQRAQEQHKIKEMGFVHLEINTLMNIVNYREKILREALYNLICMAGPVAFELAARQGLIHEKTINLEDA